MLGISDKLAAVKQRIRRAEQTYSREPGSVKLLAVSKTKPIDDILQAYKAGQRDFGESYVQEAVDKVQQVNQPDIVWHFIGPIQSNKTRLIAENFAWVHSVDRLKIAQRLSDQRSPEQSALKICLQVNVSGEQSKSGVGLDELSELVKAVMDLPRIELRGLMAIPAKSSYVDQQREAFCQLRESLEQINQQFSLNLDTLSMGMSNDLEAAIAEGASIVRVGSDIFGARE